MFRVRVVPRGKLLKNSRLDREGLDLQLPNGSRVRDLLDQLGVFEEEVRRVLVNGRRARLDYSLRRDDEVELEG
jgi:sulfur carrier protein ThiS